MTDRRTDGRTDRRTGKNNMSPDPVGGRHNYRIGTHIIRTTWGSKIKRKYIYISKQNSEIVSGSVNIQSDLFFSAFK